MPVKILRALLVIIALLLTGVSALAGCFVLFAEITGSQFYIYTQGTVLQVEHNPEVARVRFQTKEQVEVVFQMPNSFPHYEAGARVAVKYRPEHPSDAYNASFAANGLLGIGLLWFAVLCLALLSGPQIFRRYIWRQVAISLRLQRQIRG